MESESTASENELEVIGQEGNKFKAEHRQTENICL